MAGYIFDLTGINAALADWVQLKDDLLADAKIAQPLGAVTVPGDEPGSWEMVRQGVLSGENFLSHNRRIHDVVQMYITKLAAARDAYLASDEDGWLTYVADLGR